MKTLFAIIVTCSMFLTGCANRGPAARGYDIHSKGPPPHAPAHGYRHKHHGGGELVFDAERGVYAVLGLAGHYFLDGLYYRRSGQRWQMSARLDGDWHAASRNALPIGLQDDGHPGKGQGKGRNH